jgi:3-isopropylmalate/(R)-2-methylmalate dehydratase large subunit
MGMTVSEKILSRASGTKVSAGEIVQAQVDRAMSHDNAAMVSEIFQSLEYDTVWDRNRIVIPIDHRAPANIIEVANAQKRIREFVKKQSIPNFYDIKHGICHQILPEKGHVQPGWLIVGSDSHTTTYGAFGAFSTGIGATEMAAVWATGELWLKVPETIRIDLSGTLPFRVSAKDVILRIIGTLKADGASYKAVEYHGEGIRSMGISGRMTLCNMTMEMDAKAGIVSPDARTREFLESRIGGWPRELVELATPEPDANYVEAHEFELSALEPQVACPHGVDNVRPVGEVSDVEIQQVVIGSCTNGRLEDLRATAEILRGKTVHKDVRLLIVPASREVYMEAIREGIISDLLESEAVILNPGCGPCLGSHQGILAKGETALTTTNRNFRGRMGHRDSYIYLSSPETAAASARTGFITDPRSI